MHLRVYMLAGRLCVQDLQALAMQRLMQVLSQKWDYEEFLLCVREVYKCVSDHSRTIRFAFINTAVARAHDMIRREEFREFVHEGGEFVADYVEGLLQA